MKKYSITTIKLFLSVFIVLVGVFFINTIQAHAADFPKDFPYKNNGEFNVACSWGTTAKIRCSDNGGTASTDIDPRAGGGYQSDHYLDVKSTAEAGHLVFKADAKLSAHGYLHLNNDVSSGNITDSPTDGQGGYFVTPVKDDYRFIGDINETGNICAVNNLDVGCVNGFDKVSKVQDQTALNKVKVIVQEQKDRFEALNACDNSNAPLPFIFCPILNGIQGAIGGLIGGSGQVTEARQGLLISFLSLPPIDTREDPNAALNIVMGTVVNIANSLYIIIFILLIFSGSIPFLNLDSYTIKKTLPKFIGAIILTQFALPICSVIVDFFNLIALAIPNVLFALVQGLGSATPETASTASKVVGGVGGTLAAGGVIAGGIAAAATIGWILILILAIAALIAAIVAIAYLLIRYFILYVLIILSPLAFACWVLPGTEKFFKMWWKNFIKLNAMFVTIMALLSGSIVISSIISKLPGAANGALIAAVIPIIALLLVPKTLKWTTQGMSAIATGALGAVSGVGSKAAKAGTRTATKAAKEGLNDKRIEFGGRMADSNNKFVRGLGGGLATGRSTTSGVNKATQAYNKQIDQAKADKATELDRLNQKELRSSADTSMQNIKGGKTNNPRAIGAARASIEKLAQMGDSVGLARAQASFVAAGKAAGANEEDIQNAWYSISGSNISSMKEMSPALADTKSQVSVETIGGEETIRFETKAGGAKHDFSSLGEEKLAALDDKALEGIIDSVNKGSASYGDFRFDQKSLEQLLSNPNSRFKSANTRKALETIAGSQYDGKI
jgi:hypothetical protein